MTVLRTDCSAEAAIIEFAFLVLTLLSIHLEREGADEASADEEVGCLVRTEVSDFPISSSQAWSNG